MSKKEIVETLVDLDLLDPRKNPFDIDEWHSLTFGLLLGLSFGFLSGWWSAILGYWFVKKEAHYFSLGFFFGLIIGHFIGKVLYPLTYLLLI